MQKFWSRTHKLIYLGVLQVLLVGFAIHGSSHHARITHSRPAHTSVRSGSRSDEAHVSGSTVEDLPVSDRVSSSNHQNHSQAHSTPAVALLAAPPLLFLNDGFATLLPGRIAFHVQSREAGSVRFRGPPASSSLL